MPAELDLFCKKGKFSGFPIGFDKSNWQVLLDFLAPHDAKKVGATLQLVRLPLSHSVKKDLLKKYPDPLVFDDVVD